MKKIFFLFIIIIILIVISNNNEEVVVVNNIMDNDVMVEAIIVIPSLSTKNFMDYFNDDIEIIGIYPKINLLYKNKLGKQFYQFSKTSVQANINSFTRYYKSVLKKNNFTTDLVITNYSGIYIDKVKAYVDYNYIKNLMKKCSSCSYEI